MRIELIALMRLRAACAQAWQLQGCIGEGGWRGAWGLGVGLYSK